MGLYENRKKEIAKQAKKEGRAQPGTLAHNMAAKRELENKLKKKPQK
jgi:hypothetical protein